MNATVLSAINQQINSEFEASHAYLAMAAFCDQQKFLGAAKWLRLQSDEERDEPSLPCRRRFVVHAGHYRMSALFEV